jgi:AcrR family transcriptional regulator
MMFRKGVAEMNDKDARTNIIKVVVDMLSEVDDVEQITVRQVAERANVGIGLINYHFNSKNNLLSIAVAEYMAKMATGFLIQGNAFNSNPVEKFKTMLKELYSFGEQHEKLIRFTITQNILNGEMQTPLFLIPILKEIFEDKKDEMGLRIIALQVLLPIQIASINPTEFHLYSGIDLHDEDQRNSFIHTLVDNIMKV